MMKSLQPKASILGYSYSFAAVDIKEGSLERFLLNNKQRSMSQ